MLKDNDRIFKNLYGLKGTGLNVSRGLGDWKNTKEFINKKRSKI